MKSVFFYLGLALLFTHELDSMPNHEWRVLPVLRSLPDSAGESAFIIAHIPVFALTIAYVASLNIRTRKLARNAVGAFFIAHAILHMLFSGHPDYEFSSLLSGSLIYGAALCGIAFLLLPADQSEGGRA